MVGRPGRPQAAFTGGEIDPQLWERTDLKYFSTGLRFAENIDVIPQGGYCARQGLRDVGAVSAAAARTIEFEASTGAVYDLVFSTGSFQVWGEGALLATVAVAAITADMLPEFTVAQQLDTLLIFHIDLKTQRVKHIDADEWEVDDAPFENVPLHDYGGEYDNGVPAEWTLQFVGLEEGEEPGTQPLGKFAINVSGSETLAITFDPTEPPNMSALADLVEAAILELPNIGPGLTVTVDGDDLVITFDGEDNIGDGWHVSGRVLNRSDAAVVASKTVVGILPGEPLISTDRGWPQCGLFFQQRLLMGGFRSLPNAWIMSATGDYYNFDDRLTAATGPALIPLDVPGGERLEHIKDGRNLQFFSNRREYWLAERALSRTTAPNHVMSSSYGTRRGVAVVENEGASIFVHATGSVAGEFRYTDVEGNYQSLTITLLAPHLTKDIIGQAVKKADHATAGNQLFMVQSDGQARAATILREQEVMAFGRLSSRQGVFKSVAVNARNEAGFVVERPAGRRLERLEAGLLVDEATDFAFDPPSTTITGLGRFNTREVWCLADGHVFGPFTVSGAQIVLPIAVAAATVGTWLPPLASTLPLPRTIGPNITLRRKARIHSIIVSVVDTTSIALAVNGKALQDVDLRRYGMQANVPELNQGFTGEVVLRGQRGWKFDPYVTVGQVRPGRLTVKSITREAAGL